MPMKPAEQPLTPFERAQVEQDIDKLRRFRDLPDYRKTLLLKTLAGHTLRLWAELLRLEDERDALGAELEKLQNPLVSSTPDEKPAPMCKDPLADTFAETVKDIDRADLARDEAMTKDLFGKDPVPDERREA